MSVQADIDSSGSWPFHIQKIRIFTSVIYLVSPSCCCKILQHFKKCVWGRTFYCDFCITTTGSVTKKFLSKSIEKSEAPMALLAYWLCTCSACVVAPVLTESHSRACCIRTVCHTWSHQEFHAGHDNHWVSKYWKITLVL